MLFEELNTQINKIFTQKDILYTDIPFTVKSYFILVKDIELEGKFTMSKINNINIAIIKDINIKDGYLDIMLLNYVPTILIIIPDNFIDRDIEYIAKNITDIYSYCIEAFSELFLLKNDSSLKTIFNISSMILTFKTISEFYPSEIVPHMFLDDTRKRTKSDNNIIINTLNRCFDIDVKTLLDDCGIIAIIREEKIKIDKKETE